ncbi:MAG: hypothetical protein U0V49_14660 [Saprospiraceae bacterium]
MPQKKPCVILFTTGYKNFTPSGLGGIASRDSIFVIIFVCFAQKCRQKFVFSVALQRCYNNFTPSGFGAVVLRNYALSSFLLAAKKTICDFIYNGIQKFHPTGFGGIASPDSIFVIIFVCFAQKCRQKFVLTFALQRCYNNFTPTGLGDVALRNSIYVKNFV